MASVIAEYEDVNILSANYYNILISGKESSVGGLVSDGILFGPEEDEDLSHVPYDEEEEFFYPEEDDSYERGSD